MKLTLHFDGESKNEFKGLVKEVLKTGLAEILPKVKQNKEIGDDELLTRNEVMEMLGISHSTLYHYQRQGTIPHLKIGNRVYFKKGEILNNPNLKGTTLKDFRGVHYNRA